MADVTLQTLTPDSFKLLQRMLDQVKRAPSNFFGRQSQLDDSQAPDVYIAKTPSAGVAALSGSTPGSAECVVYQIVSGVLELAAVSQVVYNLSPTALPGSTYVPIARDKFGSWVPTGARPATSACGTVTVEEVDLRCEGESLNRYVRTITFSTSTSGCLTKGAGAWVFDRTVACCDAECIPINTGTGTDPSICPCASSAGPYCVDAISGVETQGFCTGTMLAAINRAFTLVQYGLCGFYASTTFVCSDTPGAATYTLQVVLAWVASTRKWRLSFSIVGVGELMGYEAPDSWDCDDPLVLTRLNPVESDPWSFATNWPNTATLRLCSDTGTGTSGGGGGGGSIAMLGLGSATSGGASVTTLALNVTAQAGTVVVNVNSIDVGSVPGVTYNGAAMTLQFTDSPGTVAGVHLITTQFSIAVSAGAGAIVVNSALGALQANVVNITGLASQALDVFSTGSGTASAADTGTTSTSTVAAEGVEAVFGLISPGPAWDWAGDPAFTNGAQVVSDTIGGLTVVVLTEARYISSTLRTFRGQSSGVTAAGWCGGVGAYK